MTASQYPARAGAKTSDGASDAAARQVDSNRDRRLNTQVEIIMTSLLEDDLVIDQVAHHVGEDRLYVRPRASELVNLGVMVKAKRKLSASFNRIAHVYAASDDLLNYIELKDPKDEAHLKQIIAAFILQRIEAERATAVEAMGPLKAPRSDRRAG